MDPSCPGLSFHRLDRGKDRNFWSIRVSRDLRIIVHRIDSTLLQCYVDHHDRAYDWAERRKLVTHPKTGATQIVARGASLSAIDSYRFAHQRLIRTFQSNYGTKLQRATHVLIFRKD